MAACGAKKNLEEDEEVKEELVTIGKDHKLRWATTTIRCKDPKVSIPFYETHFGMKMIQKIEMSTLKPQRTNYYLITMKEEQKEADPTVDVAVVLAHHWGDENKADLKLNHGNDTEMGRGFGHIAFNCADVNASCKKLEEAGVGFKKKPNEGRMKGLAFALDPDGYWIEIVKRNAKQVYAPEFNLSQTMLRVKDPKKSVPFYTDLMGMDKMVEIDFPKDKGDFGLFFLANLTDADKALANFKMGKDLDSTIKVIWQPALELTWNHGTESQAEFKYHNGIDDPAGFHSLGFLVDDLPALIKKLKAKGVDTSKSVVPWNKKGKGLMTMITDPDGYQIQLTDRKLYKAIMEQAAAAAEEEAKEAEAAEEAEPAPAPAAAAPAADAAEAEPAPAPAAATEE